MASNTQYYIWAALFENVYFELERRFGDRKGCEVASKRERKQVRGGMLEYSLDRWQDQKEEVEVEGNLPKDKNKSKKSKSQSSLCCIARDSFEVLKRGWYRVALIFSTPLTGIHSLALSHAYETKRR